MSLLSQIDNLSESDKSRAVKQLITESTPDFDFFLLVTLSSDAGYGDLAGRAGGMEHHTVEMAPTHTYITVP